MTQPAPPQQRAVNAGQIAAVAAVLVSASTVAGLAAAVASATGVSLGAAQALLTGLRVQLPGQSPAHLGPAARTVAATEQSYRAAYLVNAARRMQASIAQGRSYTEAVAAEKPYWQAHLAAQRNRAIAAMNVDRAAARHGSLLLGWRARMDERTSAECAAADGKNFHVGTRPFIGYPGSVHPHCRCVAVAPWVGAGLVDDVTMPATAREAVA